MRSARMPRASSRWARATRIGCSAVPPKPGLRTAPPLRRSRGIEQLHQGAPRVALEREEQLLAEELELFVPDLDATAVGRRVAQLLFAPLHEPDQPVVVGVSHGIVGGE